MHVNQIPVHCNRKSVENLERYFRKLWIAFACIRLAYASKYVALLKAQNESWNRRVCHLYCGYSSSMYRFQSNGFVMTKWKAFCENKTGKSTICTKFDDLVETQCSAEYPIAFNCIVLLAKYQQKQKHYRGLQAHITHTCDNGFYSFCVFLLSIFPAVVETKLT